LHDKALRTASKDHWSKWKDYLFTALYNSVFYNDSLAGLFTLFFNEDSIVEGFALQGGLQDSA